MLHTLTAFKHSSCLSLSPQTSGFLTQFLHGGVQLWSWRLNYATVIRWGHRHFLQWLCIFHLILKEKQIYSLQVYSSALENFSSTVCYYHEDKKIPVCRSAETSQGPAEGSFRPASFGMAPNLVGQAAAHQGHGCGGPWVRPLFNDCQLVVPPPPPLLVLIAAEQGRPPADKMLSNYPSSLQPLTACRGPARPNLWETRAKKGGKVMQASPANL